MKFQQDGITFTADRGFARAVKNGAVFKYKSCYREMYTLVKTRAEGRGDKK